MDKVQEFKYLTHVANDRSIDKVECEIVINGRRVAGGIKVLVNEKGLNLEWARVLCKKKSADFDSDIEIMV